MVYISKVEYKGIPPHLCLWRIVLAKNTQSFSYKKAISKQFKSLPIHSAALGGLIQILKDSPHSLSHNRMKCVHAANQNNPRQLLSSVKTVTKKCLSINIKTVGVQSIFV